MHETRGPMMGTYAYSLQQTIPMLIASGYGMDCQRKRVLNCTTDATCGFFFERLRVLNLGVKAQRHHSLLRVVS